MPKKGLGRGLSALISTEEEIVSGSGGVMEIDINKIEPNRNQPRKRFEESALEELAASIRQFGIIQPLIVKEEDGFYSIIAGERRWRAARIAKLAEVPAIVRDYNDMDSLQIALIENLQRKDLNPIEEAICYKRLVDEFFFSQDDVSTKIGRSRSTVSYSLSLLNLDPRVQNLMAEDRLTAGHGRVLLAVKDGEKQFGLAERIIDSELSVRESERLIKAYVESLKDEDDDEVPFSKTPKRAYTYQNVETELKSILGTKVSIRDGKNKGKIEIEYYSPDELDRLLRMFKMIENA